MPRQYQGKDLYDASATATGMNYCLNPRTNRLPSQKRKIDRLSLLDCNFGFVVFAKPSHSRRDVVGNKLVRQSTTDKLSFKHPRHPNGSRVISSSSKWHAKNKVMTKLNHEYNHANPPWKASRGSLTTNPWELAYDEKPLVSEPVIPWSVFFSECRQMVPGPCILRMDEVAKCCPRRGASCWVSTDSIERNEVKDFSGGISASGMSIFERLEEYELWWTPKRYRFSSRGCQLPSWTPLLMQNLQGRLEFLFGAGLRPTFVNLSSPGLLSNTVAGHSGTCICFFSNSLLRLYDVDYVQKAMESGSVQIQYGVATTVMLGQSLPTPCPPLFTSPSLLCELPLLVNLMPHITPTFAKTIHAKSLHKLS
ncbi:uncharacterized protein CLUP02_01390 [Colletotrichum lupini]|uniref:Uncharacterized protein n=1 Tax=Colletotrichum lupini TaxID=145971 RepID=A0A9Q8W8M1_9PEZI|nr:uncharacterized protein CLUP02_01390 [Colletotrichum lupini]UQC74738.1 hypothetical protein CLUP02_01390 [Colletotrichum lupini]